MLRFLTKYSGPRSPASDAKEHQVTAPRHTDATDAAEPGSPPELAFTMTVEVELIDAVATAVQAGGERVRQHAVERGAFTGPHVSGTVVPGGGESIVERPGVPAAATATFVLRERDGTLIRLRLSTFDDGEPGEPGDRGTLVTAVAAFDTPPGRHEHLSRRVFVAIGTRSASRLSLRIHSIE